MPILCADTKHNPSHRFLSNFIGELIRNNYQSPHRLLTSYVRVLTDCHLEDARKYEGAESPLAEGAISQMGHVLPVAQMSKFGSVALFCVFRI